MFILSLLYILHIVVWIYIVFGGFLSKGNALFIVYIAIPLVYILHMLPYHIICKMKAKTIDKHLDDFWKQLTLKEKSVELDLEIYNVIRVCFDNVEEDRIIKIVRVLQAKENSITFVRYFNMIKNMFKYSFQNPLSPQGMLILGFIVNLNLLKYYYK